MQQVAAVQSSLIEAGVTATMDGTFANDQEASASNHVLPEPDAAGSMRAAAGGDTTARTEQVDVAIVGAGLCGLACAAALHMVRPDCTIKVYERRPSPFQAGSADTEEDTAGADGTPAWAVGGGVRLEANGLKALAAINTRLAATVMSNGLYAHRVMLHDTEGGTVITHLQDQPQLQHPSARQPALVVGWAELQQLLLDQLPPGTVEWGAIATGYMDTPTATAGDGRGGVTLHLLQPSVKEDGQRDSASEEDGEHQQQQQQQSEGAGGVSSSSSAAAVSPFQAASQTAAGGRTNSGTGAAAAAEGGPTDSSMRQPDGVGGSRAPQAGGGGSVERVTVHARLLVAADGPLSVLRQQCVGDGPPTFDGTMRWVGRLPGDLLSTIPVAHEAWWLGPGMTFFSHPLSGGDVAWEAQVSSSSLAAAGLRWDQVSHSLMPVRPDHSLMTSGGSAGGAKRGAEGAHSTQQQQQGGSSSSTEAAAASSSAYGSFGTGRKVETAAAEPAGETDMEEDAVGTAAAAAAGTLQPAGRGSAAAAAVAASPNKLPVQALLLHVFSSFPAPVRHMIEATPTACFLEAPVHTRPARLLPASMGRGGVVVLGEAAHPLRPTGQEISQAFEDAAELGAAVMTWGVSREALRRCEVARRVRWRHIMQVSQALGTCSGLGGVSLHQGLLDYTVQLYHASFVQLRRVQLNKPPAGQRLLRGLGVGLLAWGTAAGVRLLLKGADSQAGPEKRRQAAGPVGRVLADVEEAGAAAGRALDSVSSAAVHLPSQLLKAAHVGITAEKGLKKGLGSAAHVVAEVAEETTGKGVDGANGSTGGVVHGQVPGKEVVVNGPGRAGRFKNAVVGRLLSAGGVVSKPFARLVRHRVVQEVAGHLGAF